MSPLFAFLLCSVGVGVLFYLDRDRSVRPSKALWLPVTWLWLVGSRPISTWFGMSPPNTPSANLDGSPADAAVFGTLIAVGVMVLLGRRKKAGRYLGVITPIIVYSVYCLVSITWSPVPGPSLKRWIKDAGDI